MNALSLAFNLIFTLVLAGFVLGLCWRMALWWRTPSPLPIPLAPAPRTRAGVLVRLAAELLFFRSLARASIYTWLPAMLMHYGLLIILIGHVRFLREALPLWLLSFIRVSGWATMAALTGLFLLLLRRIVVDRIRYVSAPSDYLHLLLLIAIMLSGVALKRLWPADLHAVGVFLRGVLGLDWQSLPPHAGLIAHLLGVVILLAIFPISKLVHAPGIAFAPTFHQRDPNRARRRAATERDE